jgi:hypothetical protein
LDTAANAARRVRRAKRDVAPAMRGTKQCAGGSLIGQRQPSEITAEKKRRICELVQGGCRPSQAARFLGIDEATVMRELKHDAAFLRQLRQSARAFRQELMESIFAWAQRSRPARAWLLKRLLAQRGR